MPDLEQGYFLDAGAAYFLPRINGNPALGLYLALSSHKLRGKEALDYGVATHYFPSEVLKGLKQTVRDNAQLTMRDPERWVQDLFAACHQPEKAKSIPDIDEINEIFSVDGTISDVFAKLSKSKSPFAARTLELLRSKSPLAVALTFELLKRANGEGQVQALELEKKMYAGLAIQGKDDYEFVPAPASGERKRPLWKHRSVEEVTPEEIDWYFNRSKDIPRAYLAFADYEIQDLDRIVFDEFTDFWFDDPTTGLFWDRDLRPNNWPVHWFVHNEEIDATVKKKFGKYFNDLGAGRYDHWKKDRNGRLALILLTSQYSKNCFRETA